MLETPIVHLGLTVIDKSTTNDLIYQQVYGEFVNEFDVYEKIFTDGSKSADAVGSASVGGKNFSKVFKARLPSCSSIFFCGDESFVVSSKNGLPVARRKVSYPFG